MSFLLSREITEHQQRVAKMTREFSKEYLGLNNKEAANLYLAALFHDIGKARIDPKIYNKPGKLTKEEYEEIKKHSEESANILKSLCMSEEIIKIVLYHHESYDGSGYPEGLKAEQIPYASRILKICDVYDALTNVRSYRKKPYTKDQALTVMDKMKNEFDERIFNKFKIYINNKYDNSSEKERRSKMKINKIVTIILALTIAISSILTLRTYGATIEDLNRYNTSVKMQMQPVIDRYNKLSEKELVNKFPDTQNHYAKDFIIKLNALEIISGYTDGNFGPNDTLLACQYLTMLVKALGFYPESLPGQEYWKAYVQKALDLGIVKGGEIYDYTKPITRELAATISFRALMKIEEYPEESEVWYDYNMSKISDYLEIDDRYKHDVVMAYRMGLVVGNNNIYAPKGTLTRAQGAIIIIKLIDKNLRKESVPQPGEIIVYKRRTDINEAMFDYKIKAGEEYKIYPGYFPLHEIYEVFKAMKSNLNVGGGYKEIQYYGLNNNFYVGQYVSKEKADYYFNIDNKYPTDYASFAVYQTKCYEKDTLKDIGVGYLYGLRVYDYVYYEQHMKPYVYELFKVLFEDEVDKAIQLHDYYFKVANEAVNNFKPGEWDVYMINNRQVCFRGSALSFQMDIWAKGVIEEKDMFKK